MAGAGSAGPSEKFEQVCVLVLSALIAVIIALEFKRSPSVRQSHRRVGCSGATGDQDGIACKAGEETVK